MRRGDLLALTTAVAAHNPACRGRSCKTPALQAASHQALEVVGAVAHAVTQDDVILLYEVDSVG